MTVVGELRKLAKCKEPLQQKEKKKKKENKGEKNQDEKQKIKTTKPKTKRGSRFQKRVSSQDYRFLFCPEITKLFLAKDGS